MGRLRRTIGLLARLAPVSVAAVSFVGCAASVAPDGNEGAAYDGRARGGADYSVRSPAALQSPAADPREERLAALRESAVLPSMRVHVVYIGRPGEDAADSFDSLVIGLLRGKHWGTLAEYGVHAGAFVDSAYVPSERFFTKGSIEDGLVTDAAFEELARRAMPRSQGPPLPRDGEQAELTAGAEGYVFFLPDGVNVSMGQRGTYTYSTCVDALGYHRFNGREPYAVIGPCAKGRTGFVVSHELGEMATDPIVGQGFLSVGDLSKSGGEVADLCRLEGAISIEGFSVTRYWSNSKGACVPRE